MRPQRTLTPPLPPPALSVTRALVSEVHAMMSTQEVAITSRTAVPLVTLTTEAVAKLRTRLNYWALGSPLVSVGCWKHFSKNIL